MKRLLALMFAAAIALTGLVAPSAQADEASQKANAATIAKLIDAHNALRKEHNLKPLRFVPKPAAQIAQPWSLSMQKAGRISHNSDFRFAGATAWGENVGWNIGFDDPVGEVMRAWMASKGHRENLLEPNYDLISVGAVLKGSELYATVNFYKGPLTDGGTVFDSGAQWLASVTAGVNPTNPAKDDEVYSKAGVFALNNRLWKVACEPYSQTQRCRTEIWATQVQTVKGKYERVTGWTFNNLTYAPMARSLWGQNPLVVPREHTIKDRVWKTECNTAETGTNACRSFIKTDVVSATPKAGGGYTYTVKRDEWVFNNIVRYK
ncbi:MAG: CAP domain-containing protein [Propionibacteriaceae bacterium]|nr:CAP domain-containing protein [Propionibacteriaceae bacterium]